MSAAVGASPHTRTGAGAALVEVLGTPGRIVGFAAAAVAVALAYTILLPFDYTQRVGFANWGYLNASLLAWAVTLGLGMGLVVSIQVYAMRRVAAARAATSTAGGMAFVGSLLPSFLCCTPVIPSFLAFVGVSGVGLYGTTGALQHFFAVHQTSFLAASLALLVAASWWGLRKVAAATCLSSEQGCAPGPVRGGEGACRDDAAGHPEPETASAARQAAEPGEGASR